MSAPTLRMIKRDYPHRIAADPDTCPVCCGDRCTSDRRYGGKILRTEEETGWATLYECLACEVYHQERATA